MNSVDQTANGSKNWSPRTSCLLRAWNSASTFQSRRRAQARCRPSRTNQAWSRKRAVFHRHCAAGCAARRTSPIAGGSPPPTADSEGLDSGSNQRSIRLGRRPSWKENAGTDLAEDCRIDSELALVLAEALHDARVRGRLRRLAEDVGARPFRTTKALTKLPCGSSPPRSGSRRTRSPRRRCL